MFNGMRGLGSISELFIWGNPCCWVCCICLNGTLAVDCSKGFVPLPVNGFVPARKRGGKKKGEKKEKMRQDKLIKIN